MNKFNFGGNKKKSYSVECAATLGQQMAQLSVLVLSVALHFHT